MRQKLIAESPDIGTTKITKVLAARWREMNDAQKQPYKELFEKEKMRYEREKQFYVPPANLPKVKGKKQRKKKRDPSEPRKPKTAFIFFNLKFRTKLKEAEPTLTIPETAKRLGAMWRELTDQEKEPYVKMHAEDKIRYQKEIAAYRANNGQPIPTTHHNIQPYGEDMDDEDDSDSDDE